MHSSPAVTPQIELLPATAIAAQVRKRVTSAVEVAEAHLDRIQRLNPKLNAFVDVQPERVMAQARAADAAIARKEKIGPLHGVPVSIKSSIDVAGHRCETGSRLRAGNVAVNDAPLVSRLRSAGAVVLGVTNTPEFLMAWETDNLLYGRTNNPCDLARTAGGSSGGEAAAIAAGLSAGGIGSDGGGSIREPAHFCGICGLKPTPGRIPSSGHFPKSGGPFTLLGVVGPMARTVADVKALFEVTAGFDDGDPCAAPVPVRDITLEELNSIPVGFFEDDGRTPITPETREAVKTAAKLCERARIAVEPFRPEGLLEARQLWWKFFGIAGGMILRPMLRGHEQNLSNILREFYMWTAAEPAHTGESLLGAWLARDELRENILLQMRRRPVLICPTASIPAFVHGQREWQVDGQTVKYLDAWSYCEWFNLLGFPALVVPMGRSPEGLPIGIQIVGRPWEEELVLAVAARIEAERGEWRGPQV